MTATGAGFTGPSYVIAECTGTLIGLPTPPEGYVINAVGKQVVLAVKSTASYATWAAINAPTGTVSDDYDNDGVSNGVEYVIGGLATTNDANANNLPKVSITGGNLTFTFVRRQTSKTADPCKEGNPTLPLNEQRFAKITA